MSESTAAQKIEAEAILTDLGPPTPKILKLIQERDNAIGAMKADDERLERAAIRVWGEHTRGCDTPDEMADLIKALRERAEKAESRCERLEMGLRLARRKFEEGNDEAVWDVIQETLKACAQPK